MFKSLFKPNIERLKKNNDVFGLIDCMVKNSDAQTREGAANALREMDTSNLGAVSAFVTALKHPDAEVKKNSALGLGLAMGKLSIFHTEQGIGGIFSKYSPIALEALLILCKDNDSEIRSITATALSQLVNTQDTKGVESLLQLIDDIEPNVRVSALYHQYAFGHWRRMPNLHRLVLRIYLKIQNMLFNYRIKSKKPSKIRLRVKSPK